MHSQLSTRAGGCRRRRLDRPREASHSDGDVWRTPVQNVISRLLGERGWSDGDLATRAGLARMRVNRIKNGRARPTVAEALQIGAALGARVDQVFHLGRTDREPGEIGS